MKLKTYRDEAGRKIVFVGEISYDDLADLRLGQIELQVFDRPVHNAADVLSTFELIFRKHEQRLVRAPITPENESK